LNENPEIVLGFNMVSKLILSFLFDFGKNSSRFVEVNGLRK